jgi:hypothetical protein
MRQHGAVEATEGPFLPWPEKMSDVDTFSDAQRLLRFWWKALRLQENRLTADHPENVAADSRFAIIAAALTVQSCTLFATFGVPGVREALADFKARQPAALSLRNALEHFDEYLLGDGGRGGKRLGRVWFPFGNPRRSGRVFLRIPPLPETPYPQDFDVTQLIIDTMWLHGRVTRAIDDDFPRRMTSWRHDEST